MNGITPRLMCEACGHVFPATAKPEDEHAGDVTCPDCGHHGQPAGVMQPTGFPSLETFKRSWKQARAVERDEG